MANLGNPSGTIEILQKYNFNFQKKFGQNFLIDPRVLDKIIDAAEITEDDMVLEIGPGIGTMTQYLAEHAREVVAVEIDKNLIPILEDTLSAYENVTVINEDILKVDIRKLADERNHGNPIKVVANLPYYITTPIIMGLFENHVPLKSITIMVQKEVADRMQTEAPVFAEDEHHMFSLIRASFNQRRKTLVNGLTNGGVAQKEQVLWALSKMNLPATIRGEALTLSQFAALSNLLLSMAKEQQKIHS